MDESKIEYLLSMPDAPGVIRKVKADQVHRVDPTHELDLDNLCLLNDMHEAPLLDLLRRRFFTRRIYTFTGDVLISINPYQLVEGLYDNAIKYLDKDSFSARRGSVVSDLAAEDLFRGNSPHVYRVANQALQSLTLQHSIEAGDDHYQNQSIIISGESGAGKTENSKYVLSFLIHANNYFSQHHASGPSNMINNVSFEEHLKAVLLHSSVVLEAFGNAKTVRNDNSSRFGKYIKLLYLKEHSKHGNSTFPHLVSANTETFLLEKSRLTSIGQGERTYHVFYQLIAGLDSPDLKARLSLDQAEANFSLLLQGKCSSMESDRQEFLATNEALRTLQFTNTEIEHIWTLVSCVMHLYNIQLEESEQTQAPVKVSCPTITVDRLAQFLGVEAAQFTFSLTTQELQVARRASIKMKILSEGEVRNNVNALMKWLYSKLFDWIVRKINACHSSLSTGRDISGAQFIGILDIFGFEILNVNSFEQLCINFTNERLQQQFNEHVFVSEQAMYAQEGLEWSNINFRDNQPIIDVISSTKKPMGLLLVLEEHGLLNRKPDDIALLNGFNQVHEAPPAVGKAAKAAAATALYSKSRFGNDSFVLRHFAGEVTYTVDGFLSKNNDALQEDLMKLLKCSASDFLIDMAQIERPPKRGSVFGTLGGMLGGSKEPASKKMASSASVSQQFRLQLDMLMTTLRSTTPHYIKCIKPNGEKVAESFNAQLVIQQLRYSGVLEVVRIRREGFPLRVSFLDFYRNYSILNKGKDMIVIEDCNQEVQRELVHVMLQLALLPGQFQLGHSMVFLRQDGLHEMKEAVKRFYGNKIMVIQAMVRGRRTRRWFLNLQWGVRKMQSLARMFTARAAFCAQRRASTQIKRFYFAKRARKMFLIRYAQIVLARRQLAAKNVQRRYRGWAQRKIFKVLLIARRKLLTESAIKMQCAVRVFCSKKVYQKLLQEKMVEDTVIYLQSCVRRYRARCLFAVIVQADRERKAATVMQAIVRRYRGRCLFALIVQADKERKAATLMQAIVRRFISKNIFVKMQCLEMKEHAAIVMQSAVRAFMQRRMFKRCLCALTKIQSIARVYICRKWFKKQVQCLIRMQSVVRQFIFIRRYRVLYGSVIAIQTTFRMFRSRRQVDIMYASIMCLQSWARMIRVRRGFQLNLGRIIYVQALVRGYIQRRSLKIMAFAATLIQANARRMICTNRYNLMFCSTLAIQSTARMHIARSRYRRERKLLICLQAYLRKLYYRRQYLIAWCQIAFAQKLVRGYVYRRRYLRILHAVQRLQAFGRMLNAYKAYSTAVISIIMIQARVRVFLCRNMFKFFRSQAVRIQKVARGMRDRKVFFLQYGAVIKLQSFGRMINSKRKYDECVISAIIIQALCRKFIATMRYRKARRKCIKVQSLFRMLLGKLAYKRHIKAIVCIQSFGRMLIMRQTYDNQLVSIIVMQTVIRGGLLRRRYERMQKTCLRFQNIFRMHIARRKLRKALHAVNAIAKTVRCHQQFVAFNRKRASCWRIQIAVRSFIRNLRLFRRLKDLHYACSTDLATIPAQESEVLVQSITNHLRTFPGDRLVRFRPWQMRTVLHSLLVGQNEQFIGKLSFTAQDAFEIDRLGRNSAHYAALSGNFKCFRAVANLVNTFKFQSVATMQALDEDDDDNEESAANAHLKQVLSSSVGKSSLKQGWLKKKRGGIMWQRRWVVLTEDYIIYYKNNTSLNNPKFAIPLAGCTVFRVPGREPVVEVTAPNMVEKRSFFGSSNKKAMGFMAENEKELQEWFLPLKAVAGVQNLREKPVHYINTELRRLWLNSLDFTGENLLHVLARGSFAPSPYDEEDFLRFFDKNRVLEKPKFTAVSMNEKMQMLAWCLQFDCAINDQNEQGDTPLHLAVQAGSLPLVYCLLIKGADGMDIVDDRGRSVWDICKDKPDLKAIFSLVASASSVPSSLAQRGAKGERDFTNTGKLKGYSYFSVCFGQQQFQHDM